MYAYLHQMRPNDVLFLFLYFQTAISHIKKWSNKAIVISCTVFEYWKFPFLVCLKRRAPHQTSWLLVSLRSAPGLIRENSHFPMLLSFYCGVIQILETILFAFYAVWHLWPCRYRRSSYATKGEFTNTVSFTGRGPVWGHIHSVRFSGFLFFHVERRNHTLLKCTYCSYTRIILQMYELSLIYFRMVKP